MFAFSRVQFGVLNSKRFISTSKSIQQQQQQNSFRSQNKNNNRSFKSNYNNSTKYDNNTNNNNNTNDAQNQRVMMPRKREALDLPALISKFHELKDQNKLLNNTNSTTTTTTTTTNTIDNNIELKKSNNDKILGELFSKITDDMQNWKTEDEWKTMKSLFDMVVESNSETNKNLVRSNLYSDTLSRLNELNSTSLRFTEVISDKQSRLDWFSSKNFSSLISVLAKNGRWNLLQEILNEMREKSMAPTHVDWGLIVYRLIMGRHTHKGVELALLLLENGVPLQGWVLAASLKQLLRDERTYAKKNGIQLWDVLLKRPDLFKPHPEIVSLVAEAYSTLQQFEQVGKLIADHSNDDSISYNNIIRGFVKSGNMDLALRLLRSFTPDTESFAILIKALMSRNQLEMANKLLESMKTEFQLDADETVLDAMLDGLSSLDKIDEACWMYDRLEEEFRVSPTPWMFQKLLVKLMKSKNPDHSVESAKRMIQGLEKRADFHLSNKLVYQLLSQLGNRSVRLHREWRTRVYNFFNANPQRFSDNDAFFTSSTKNNIGVGKKTSSKERF